jgi:hypothetical protein
VTHFQVNLQSVIDLNRGPLLIFLLVGVRDVTPAAVAQEFHIKTLVFQTPKPLLQQLQDVYTRLNPLTPQMTFMTINPGNAISIQYRIITYHVLFKNTKFQNWLISCKNK